MREYVKHLVQCKCILQQFKRMPSPPFHKFIVFSEIEESGKIVPSMAQCPNCGVVHKVEEVGVSTVLKKEDLSSVLKPEEIRDSLPEKVKNAISGYDLELHQLQEINFILENKAWGKSVILTKETGGNLVSGKYIQFLSDNIHRFGNFSREDAEAEK